MRSCSCTSIQSERTTLLWLPPSLFCELLNSLQIMDTPKQKGFRASNGYKSKSAGEAQYLPVSPPLERDLHARETAAIFRLSLALVVVVGVFFIVVFGILGAVAHAVGDAFGLHHNYADVAGTH